MKVAMLTGITGQDGAYLAEYLLDMNYKVIALVRRTSSVNDWRLRELNLLGRKNLVLQPADVTDLSDIIRSLEKYEPEEFYNLAAQSFVAASFTQPFTTADITALGPHRILEAIRIVNDKIKFYQASSSEMFGKVQEIPQNENTSFYPRSPYAVSKLYAHWITVNYRESYNIFASSGILFNHESPLRGIEFVTRKITDAVARIKLGQQEVLELGNMGAQRDWGYAKDYVTCMHKMLQIDTPDTFVLATNKTYTVRSFVEMAFLAAGIFVKWSGQGKDEVGIDESTGKIVTRVNPEFYRPAEVDLLIGDYSKAKTMLGWEPQMDVEELCKIMVMSDIKRVEKELRIEDYEKTQKPAAVNE